MSDKGKQGRKRSKSYYFNKTKRQKNVSLEPGMKGFLVTCNNKLKECLFESYNLLNEYADQLYGEEQITGNAEDDLSDKDDDIEKSIEKTVQNLKNPKQEEHRFSAVVSGVNNCLFIKTTISDPCHLVTAILTDLEKKKILKSRFIFRLLPIEVTCRAYMDNVKKSVEELTEKYFSLDSQGMTFAVNFKVRNNNQMKRDDIINMVVKVIQDRSLDHRVNLTKPDFLINIDILKTVACISVLQDYYKFKKYNLHKLINQDMKKEIETINTINNGSSDKIPVDKELKEDGVKSENVDVCNKKTENLMQPDIDFTLDEANSFKYF